MLQHPDNATLTLDSRVLKAKAFMMNQFGVEPLGGGRGKKPNYSVHLYAVDASPNATMGGFKLVSSQHDAQDNTEMADATNKKDAHKKQQHKQVYMGFEIV